MWLTSSSIGRKFVMALTGCALVLFVTFHCLMNTVAILWPAAYNEICMFLGANWYALIASAALAVLVIIHIIYAIWLTIQNRAARGEDRYAVNGMPPHVEWSSKNMLVLGIVVLAFLGVHLYQFWAKMQLREIMGSYAVANGAALPPEFGTLFLQQAFGNWWAGLIYIIGFVALWLHMTHGFWSMFHTVGWDSNRWIKRLKCIGNVWTTLVVLLFVAQVLVFTVYANAGKCADYIVKEAQTKVSLGKADAAYLAKAEETAAKLQKLNRFVNDPACQAQYTEYWTEHAEELNASLMHDLEEAANNATTPIYDQASYMQVCMPVIEKYMPKYTQLVGTIKVQCPNAQAESLESAQMYYQQMQQMVEQYRYMSAPQPDYAPEPAIEQVEEEVTIEE